MPLELKDAVVHSVSYLKQLLSDVPALKHSLADNAYVDPPMNLKLQEAEKRWWIVV